MTLQAEKRKARRALHKAMARAAFYIVDESAPGNPPPTVYVRVHYKFDPNGDTSVGQHYADVREQIPKLIFLREEVAAPARGAVVTLSDVEAYRIDLIDPPDDITVKATVTPMDVTEIVGLPVPPEE